MPWINHPACQDGPVTYRRYWKYVASDFLNRWARHLEYEALHPNCQDCGKPRKKGDHSNCLEVPF